MSQVEKKIIDDEAEEIEEARNKIEYDRLLNEQEYYKRLRFAIWAIDTLLKEKRVNLKSTVNDFLIIVEERKEELGDTNLSSKELLNKPSGSDNSADELNRAAEEEHKTSRKLLECFDDAQIVLGDLSKAKAIFSHTSLGVVRDILNEKISQEEKEIDMNEIDKRKNSSK